MVRVFVKAWLSRHALILIWPGEACAKHPCSEANFERSQILCVWKRVLRLKVPLIVIGATGTKKPLAAGKREWRSSLCGRITRVREDQDSDQGIMIARFVCTGRHS